MRRTVHSDVTQVVEKLLSVINVRVELEQARRAVNEICREVGAQKGRAIQHVQQERNVRLDTADTEFVQGTVHFLHGGFKVLLGARELHQQRIVVRRHAGTDDNLAIKTDAHTTRRSVHFNLTKVRCKVHGWIFRRNSALHGETSELNVILRLDADVRKLLTASNQDLRLHQINASHFFRHRVLDLDARIHLEEVVATLGVNHEFDGACVAVIDVLCELDCVVKQALTKHRVEVWRRSEFDNLLVATLHGAITLAQVNDVTIVVAEDLYLNVTRRLNVALQEHTTVAKSRRRFARRALESIFEVIELSDDAHAASTTTHGSLEHDRHTELLGERQRVFNAVGGFLRTWHQRKAAFLRLRLGNNLIAHFDESLRARANQDDPFLLASSREIRIFAQQTVTRVDGLRPVLLGDANDGLIVQVRGNRRLSTTDLIRFVSLVSVRRLTIRFREDGDRLHTELGAGSEDANRDLASIRAKNLRKPALRSEN